MAVSGLFYPAEPAALHEKLEALLADARPADADLARGRPKALIVPHAGYAYSGAVAATAYALLARTLADGPPITRVVLLGPAHRVWCRGLAEPGVDFLETPLGAMRVDRAALADLPGRSDGRRAHGPEHALEVQLPFLRTLLPDAGVVPLLVCEATTDQVARAIDHLWGGPETLVLVSTDLSHFQPYAEARTFDTETAAHLVAQGPPVLTGDQACGATALNGLLAHIAGRGWPLTCLDLRSSGDTAGGRREVVGYGAFGLWTEPSPS
jgi:AmmeMemoRadiSam system protein B